MGEEIYDLVVNANHMMTPRDRQHFVYFFQQNMALGWGMTDAIRATAEGFAYAGYQIDPRTATFRKVG